MRTNSQIQLSSKLYLCDIDGDEVDELIEIDGRRISVFKANSDHTPVLDHAFASPVQRLVIGDFVNRGREHGKDQLLAILGDGSIQGFAISDDLSELWWWFTQASFIKPGHEYIVGDFDGDGADEILVYRPSTGAVTIFKMRPGGGMGRMPGYSLGNLRGRDRKNKLFLAGEFGQANNRSDLLMIDRERGQVSRFDAATDDRGTKTFWWAFTSRTRRFGSRDDLCVANVDGGPKDALIVRNHGTGRYRLYELEYNNGYLRPVANVALGQLPRKRRTGHILPAKVRERRHRRETGGSRRDDILFFDERTGEFIRTDARFDRTRRQLTYWWAYTSNLLFEPQREPLQRPWAVMLCRFKGMSGDSNVEKYFREMFTPGKGGMIEYWHDISLGVIDVSKSRVFGWIELDMRRSEAAGKSRGELIDAAIAATKRAGFDPVRGFHSQIAVFTHDFSRAGAPAGANWRHPTWGQYWIDGSADSRGRVSAPPHGHSGSFIAHEMGHGMGFAHDLKPNLTSHYGDPNCIMSAMAVRSYAHPDWGKAFGPAMSLTQLDIKSWMYERRLNRPSRAWLTGPGLDFELAPLSDRRQSAFLGAILAANRSATWSYDLEYMVPTVWNQGLMQPRLVVRRRVRNTAAFLGEVVVPTRRGTRASWTEPTGNVRFEIEKTRTDNRRIEVRVRKL